MALPLSLQPLLRLGQTDRPETHTRSPSATNSSSPSMYSTRSNDVYSPRGQVHPQPYPSQQLVLQQLQNSQHYSNWPSPSCYCTAACRSIAINSLIISSSGIQHDHTSSWPSSCNSSNQASRLVIASPAEASSSNNSSPNNSSSSRSGAGSARSWSDIWRSAGAQALGGGLPGSAAMVVQVSSNCTTAAVDLQLLLEATVAFCWNGKRCLCVCQAAVVSETGGLVSAA